MSKKFKRIFAFFMVINLVFDTVFPTAALALTSGPSQPEVQSFTPVGTSDMVNLFTGDFNYNIPLLDVEGYPVNIAYNSGISNDQEASWVGLGWNINPGTINRNMRSFPDDFNGDAVIKELNMKPNQTFGLDAALSVELFGIDASTVTGNFSLGLKYNTYSGVGMSIGATLGIGPDKSHDGFTGSLGLSSGSEQGLGISANVGYSQRLQGTEDSQGNCKHNSGSLGLEFNTRGGLQALTISGTYAKKTVDDKGNTIKSAEKGGSFAYTFANPTYTPYVGPKMINVGLSVQFTFGIAAFGTHPKLSLGGSYNGEFLKDKTTNYQAYGYLNTQNGTSYNTNRSNILLDLNRENDRSYTQHTPDLPVTNFSYDVFSVSGQGIGGTYRPFRNDVGIVHDATIDNVADISGSVGIEIGAGEAAHTGVNVSLTETNSESGKWKDDNDIKSLFVFTGEDITRPLYEPTYFKQAGEKTAETDLNFFNNVISGYDPIRIQLYTTGPTAHSTATYVVGQAGSGTTTKSIPSTVTKSNRTRRNEAIATLNAGDATNFGLVKTIDSYAQNDFTMFQPNYTGASVTNMPRVDNNKMSYHISEISAYRADGAKYVYGIPAYNSIQKEASFAIQTINGTGATLQTPDFNTGLIGYAGGGTDNSTGNSNGLDNYFSRTTLPAYAHSYLLTAVLSADYVDVTGDGPTKDDLGTYTKINYTRATDNYQWRTPFANANYNQGMMSDGGGPIGDDKASYVYGKKEVWYVHSIESKNYVAEFFTSSRHDGFGVNGEDGGISTAVAVQQLDSIQLHAKQDLLNNPNTSYATSLKTVHFVYDYSLCQGQTITNSISDYYSDNTTTTSQLINNDPSSTAMGKLTLKKVYFTYQNSHKGQLSPYIFNYADNDQNGSAESNFNYNMKSYDRWGNYKPNKVAPSYSASDVSNQDVSTAEFPYTNQEPGVADSYSAAWNLTSIQLPSGGIIKVNYEADDYAYVQDQNAMQMFTVSGTSINPGTGLANILYSGSGPGINNYKYLYIPYSADLQKQVNFYTSTSGGSNSIPGALQKILLTNSDNTNMTYLYFKFLLDVERNESIYNDKYEYVAGYAKVDYSGGGACGLDGSNVFIRLETVSVLDNINLGYKINPIAMAGINFTRLYLPHVAYDNQQDPTGFSLMDIFQALKSAFIPIVQFFEGGMANALIMNKASQKFIPQRSFIRLYNPSKTKKGGGSRVKTLTLNDNWKTLTTQSTYINTDYGQQYSYKTLDRDGREISSGVASYEPVMGGDENPMRQPVFFEEKHILAPSDDYYLETPFGESFFPSAVVGYSRVQVQNIVPSTVNRHASGVVVHEFYTAKDFPIKVTPTDVDQRHHKPNILLKLLKLSTLDYMTTSQGYVIELNDMHGKEKAQFVYKQDPTPIPLTSGSPQTPVNYTSNYYGNNYISGIQYNYSHNSDRLNNNVPVIDKTGNIQNNYVGVDYDMTLDMEEHKSITRNGSLHGNLEVFLLAIFPGIVPTVFPGYSQEKVRYRSSVVTKVMNTYGILTETIATDLGSQVSTQNQLWDAETGEVLLTQTINNFDDNIFAMTYPAHWAYDRMGGAYKNIGAIIPVSQASTYCVIGDEVSFSGVKGWVTSVSPFTTVDITGVVNTPSGGNITILRSGRRNEQALPVGKIVSLKTPINSGGTGLSIDQSTKVISASAAEFSDSWTTFCECGITPDHIYNPFIIGIEGNWRPQKSSVYLTGRAQTIQNNNTNIRTDGPYTTFSPFWKPNATAPNDWISNTNSTTPDNSWQFTTQMTIYSPYGFELENKDALNRYSSAIYGYNNTLPISVSSNANYKQIGFDGFEDYDFRACQDDHFGFKLGYDQTANNYVTQAGSVNQKYSHTGRRSIKVPSGQSAIIQKIIDNCSSQSTGNNTDGSSPNIGLSGNSGNTGNTGNSNNATHRAPIVNITSPSLNPFSTNVSTINVTAGVAPAASINVTYNGSPITFSFNGLNLSFTSSLVVGTNTFIITATNSYGSNTQTLVVNYAP